MPKRKSKKTGLPPGSVVFTGKQRTDAPLVKALVFDNKQMKASRQLPDIPTDEGRLAWVDITGLHEVDFLKQIGEKYSLHNIVLEDVADIYQRPKAEETANGVFFVVKSLSLGKKKGQRHLEVEQISIYVTKNVVLSFQEDDVDDFASIRERLNDPDGRLRNRGAGYLLYRMLDVVVDGYFAVIDELEEAAEALEGKLLNGTQKIGKQDIHLLRLQAAALRKFIAPLRDSISRLLRTEHASMLKHDDEIYFRDLLDHVVHAADLSESLRESANGLYDLYISEIGFHTNRVMSLLTIISTIFIPLTFLVGVYGMNFDNMPELHYKYGYFVLWLIMLLIFLAQLYFFKRKKWL
jgi:magnesium transporter